MDPEVLVYIFFFIVVAIVQGIGQKKKEAQRRGQKPPAGAGTGREAGTATLPPERARPRAGSPTREVGTPPSRAGKQENSSEGMVPQEVWEEILGLARGTPPKPKSPPSTPPPGRRDEVEVYRAPGSLEEIPEFEARSLEDLEPREEREAPVERDRSPRGHTPGRGLPTVADSSSRSVTEAELISPPGGLGAPIASGGGRADGQRGSWVGGKVFQEGSVEELRKAIILKEVLGPPVSLRDE